MRIGIGLPNPVPDTDGDTLVRWAERAEEAGFSSLATIDRIVYPSYDSLISLAAAAAVTKRIGLKTNILIAPLRDEVLLAKDAASVESGSQLHDERTERVPCRRSHQGLEHRAAAGRDLRAYPPHLGPAR
jgi:hypothetical protein